jgi:hypothetical protein
MTRSLFLPDSALASWSGVEAYLYDAGAGVVTFAADYPYTGAPLSFYEVSVVGTQGSWWLPTALQGSMPAAWQGDRYGGFSTLQATGTAIWTEVGGQAVVRPALLYWWIPAATLTSSPNTPGASTGTIEGQPPTTAPVSSMVISGSAQGVRVAFGSQSTRAVANDGRLRVRFPS